MQLPIDCFSWVPPLLRARLIALVWIGFKSAHGHKGGSQADVIVCFEEIVFVFRGECFWIYNHSVKQRFGNIFGQPYRKCGYMKRAVLGRDFMCVSITLLSDTWGGCSGNDISPLNGYDYWFVFWNSRIQFVARKRLSWLKSAPVFLVFFF
jgi:hypothetical protein